MLPDEHGTRMSTAVVDVVHDLRAPLAALATQVRGLAESELPPGSADEVRLMGRTLDALASRVDSLLTSERERRPIGPPETLDLWEIAAEVTQQLRPLARARNRTITLQGAPELHVTGRREELTSAVQNLVDNALRHAPDGGAVDVTVRCHRGLAKVLVSDDGPGIPRGERDRLRRMGESGHRDGTGIGLGLVDRVARAHGGRLRLADAPAGGALAELAIPHRRSAGGRARAALRRMGPASSPLAEASPLLVRS